MKKVYKAEKVSDAHHFDTLYNGLLEDYIEGGYPGKMCYGDISCDCFDIEKLLKYLQTVKELGATHIGFEYQECGEGVDSLQAYSCTELTTAETIDKLVQEIKRLDERMVDDEYMIEKKKKDFEDTIKEYRKTQKQIKKRIEKLKEYENK